MVFLRWNEVFCFVFFWKLPLISNTFAWTLIWSPWYTKNAVVIILTRHQTPTTIYCSLIFVHVEDCSPYYCPLLYNVCNVFNAMLTINTQRVENFDIKAFVVVGLRITSIFNYCLLFLNGFIMFIPILLFLFFLPLLMLLYTDGDDGHLA